VLFVTLAPFSRCALCCIHLKRYTAMKSATAKELRHKTAALLAEVRRGRRVLITYRGKQIAVLAPLDRTTQPDFEPAGFGMWKGRRDMRSVDRWLNKMRSPRFEA
jgi:prevent-host-death family protein